MSQLRSGSQVAQPQGFVPKQTWPALLLASGAEGWKPLQLRKVLVQGLTPRVDSPMQVKWGGLFAGSEPLRAHSVSQAACLHISHLVWETKQPTCFSRQHHFQGTIFTCSVQTQNKTQTHILFIRQNCIWAKVWGLTQNFQWVLPPGSTRAGFIEAPPWLMTTAQEKQSCCGDNLTFIKLQKIKSILQIDKIQKMSFVTVIPGGSKEKRGNSLSPSSCLTSFGVGSVGISTDTNFCD